MRSTWDQSLIKIVKNIFEENCNFVTATTNFEFSEKIINCSEILPKYTHYQIWLKSFYAFGFSWLHRRQTDFVPKLFLWLRGSQNEDSYKKTYDRLFDPSDNFNVIIIQL